MGLEPELDSRGIESVILADGSALPYLAARTISAQPLGSGANSIEKTLDDLRPALVVVGTSENPVSIDLALLDRARDRGIITVGALDAYCNAERRFRGDGDNALAHRPDYLMVPDTETCHSFRDLGFPREAMTVCGHPHYDFVRAEGARLRAAETREALRSRLAPTASSKRLVTFLSEPVANSHLSRAAGYHEETYTLCGRGGSRNRTAIVMEELLDAVAPLRDRIHLMLRVHPREQDGEFAVYHREFDGISRGGDVLELLQVSDLVVGITSMALTEAALLGRPTLAILPRAEERDDLAVLRSSLVASPATRDAVEKSLHELIANPTAPSAAALEELLPSGATARACRFLEELYKSVLSEPRRS